MSLESDVFVRSNVTKTIHNTVYPAIDPKRPELSEKGRTVLITGGNGTIGYPIASAFVQASASRVIILGRKASSLAATVQKLQVEAAALAVDTIITSKVVDLANTDSIDELWKSLAENNIIVHTLVLSASALSPGQKTLLELGREYVWGMFESSVRSILWFAENFQKQGGPGKSLVWLTSAASHAWSQPAITNLGSYSAIKVSGGQIVQQLAFDTKPEDMQVNIYHPGAVFTEGWRDVGFTEDMLMFDKAELGGAFAVWAASPEARFLHGRMVWASWDVEELARPEIRGKLEQDIELLRYGVDGLYGGDKRKW